MDRTARPRARLWGLACAAALVLAALSPAAARAADSLVWRAAERRVDADVRAWPLPRLLDAIAKATGWQVFVEPGVEHTVTARFENLRPVDALLRLLGDVSFALIPQPSGPTRLLVYRRSADAATERAGAPPPARASDAVPIPNELLVVLKRDATGDADRLARRLGATVAGRLGAARAYRLRFADADAARRARADLAREGDVESVETNVALAPPAGLEPLPIGTLPDGVRRPTIEPAGDEVLVGLIDDAVQVDAKGLAGFLQEGVSVAGGVQPPTDRLTHGTAMAQAILEGVAQALGERGDGRSAVPLSILPVDVYGPNARTNTFDLARGISVALDRRVNVVNLSLSGETDSPLLRTLLADAARKGVLVFGAAGNEPVETPTYPAAYPSTIAVTASDGAGGIAPWANRGPFVDALGPGTGVFTFGDRSWLATGTSVSSGWVSGWAAGAMASAGRRSPAAVRGATLERWSPPPGMRR